MHICWLAYVAPAGQFRAAGILAKHLVWLFPSRLNAITCINQAAE